MSPAFSASYDSTTKVISAAVCAIFLAVGIAGKNGLLGILSAGIGAAALVLSFAYSPRGYSISDGAVIVKRLIGNVRISLDHILDLRVATSDDLSGCIRLWGNGGFFGYYGLYSTRKLGRCTWYLTNRSKAVVLITSAKTALFSPDDVEGFLAAVRKEAPVPETPELAPKALAPPRRRVSLVAWIGVPIVLIVTAVIGFALLYSPGPPPFTLTAGALTIHDRFYPVTLQAADVDVGAVRIVDIMSDPDWRPTLRTNGFANGHYRAGWFRAANGQAARMYWADGRRLVLLPPRGAGSAVLLEVPEPGRFIEELRREWTRVPVLSLPPGSR